MTVNKNQLQRELMGVFPKKNSLVLYIKYAFWGVLDIRYTLNSHV